MNAEVRRYRITWEDLRHRSHETMVRAVDEIDARAQVTRRADVAIIRKVEVLACGTGT